MTDFERAYYIEALVRQKLNISACARYLGVNRNTLQTRLQKLGIWSNE